MWGRGIVGEKRKKGERDQRYSTVHSDLSLQNPGKSASCHDSVNDIQYVTVYSDSHYSTLL